MAWLIIKILPFHGYKSSLKYVNSKVVYKIEPMNETINKFKTIGLKTIFLSLMIKK